MAASRGRLRVRSLPGVMPWRSRYGLAGGCCGGGQPGPSQTRGRGAIYRRGLAASRSDRNDTEPPLPWLKRWRYSHRVDCEVSLGVA